MNAGRRALPLAHLLFELTAACVVVSVTYAVHEAREAVPARGQKAQGERQ